MNKNMLCSLLVLILAVAPSVYAGKVELTTYYPAPYGEYTTLQASTLYFQETGLSPNGLIGFNYADTIYDGRLRITAGQADTRDNDQGASIDLHGIAHANIGRLDLVAGRAGDIVFFTSPVGTSGAERMRINSAGDVGIGAVPTSVTDKADLTLSGTIVQEAWHNIGPPDGPAFQGGWQPLYSPGYLRDKNGFVHLKGDVYVQSGSAILNTVIFFLPSGYRPIHPQGTLFSVVAVRNTPPSTNTFDFAVLVIGHDGMVYVLKAPTIPSGGSVQLILDSITFMTNGY